MYGVLPASQLISVRQIGQSATFAIDANRWKVRFEKSCCFFKDVGTCTLFSVLALCLQRCLTSEPFSHVHDNSDFVTITTDASENSARIAFLSSDSFCTVMVDKHKELLVEKFFLNVVFIHNSS